MSSQQFADLERWLQWERCRMAELPAVRTAAKQVANVTLIRGVQKDAKPAAHVNAFGQEPACHPDPSPGSAPARSGASGRRPRRTAPRRRPGAAAAGPPAAGGVRWRTGCWGSGNTRCPGCPVHDTCNHAWTCLLTDDASDLQVPSSLVSGMPWNPVVMTRASDISLAMRMLPLKGIEPTRCPQYGSMLRAYQA